MRRFLLSGYTTLLLDVSVEGERERNRQVLWWCNVGEGVADVLNALYLFHVVVIEEGASRYSPNAPIHVFFMSFFQSLVLQCAFALLASDLHVSCVILLLVDLCYFVACRPLLYGTR